MGGFMIRRIDHISIAVRDLDQARKFFLDILGGRELFCAPVPAQKFRWTTLELGTSCFIELIDPLEKDGFVHKFLESRGEGPHHITIQVDDLGKVHERLQEKGVPTFGYAEPFPGWKELYVHPKNAFGTLIQFAEFNPLDWIEKGYIPPSYREFMPPKKLGEGKDRLDVRFVRTDGGGCVEVAQGENVVRIPQSCLEEFIAILPREAKADPASIK
jgi:methylmalonyl-CoA/ethylmalonyl-CoA epimerase